jgi:hypothetical protein
LLSRYKRVDSGGKVRNNIGAIVADKMAFLRRYKFSIAFENSQHPGYTTEKILHALTAGSIPIYWGNPRIAEDFNPRAFINCHDYRNMQDVVAAVRAVDEDENLYRAFLAEPYFPNGVENAYVREENIVAKFGQIFAARQAFIPRRVKAMQYLRDRMAYYLSSCKRRLFNVVRSGPR